MCIVVQFIQESDVILGRHDAEADVFAFELFEGGTVAYHEALADEVIEGFLGGEAGGEQADQDEIGVGRVGFQVAVACQCFQHAGALAKDQGPGSGNIGFVGEHEPAGECADAAKAPWVLHLDQG